MDTEPPKMALYIAVDFGHCTVSLGFSSDGIPNPHLLSKKVSYYGGQFSTVEEHGTAHLSVVPTKSYFEIR